MKMSYAALTAGLLLGTTLTGAAWAQTMDGTISGPAPGVHHGSPGAPMPPQPLPPSEPTAIPATPGEALDGGRMSADSSGSAMTTTTASPAPDAAATGNPASTDAPATTASGDTTVKTDGTPESPRVLAEIDTDSVSGSERQKNALVSTQLLNRFNTLGFAEVKEFTREGKGYKTEAKSTDGDWVTVMIDPEAGQITQQ